MNERIKQIRKSKGMTLADFGKIIGIQSSGVSKMEKGVTSVTNQTINTIVREFGVNEQWLRYGEGEMFPEKTEAEELASLVPKIIKSDNPFVIKTLTEMCKLSPECWDEIEKMIRKIAKED